MSPSLCLQDLAELFATPVQRRSAPADSACLNWPFERICTDSRALRPGDLFVPLRGERFDGHDFLEAAVEVGVAGALVARDWNGYLPETLTYLPVVDTLAAYQQVALRWRQQLPIPVVAVTGSAGKTTTRELIRACLQPLGIVEASSGNENNDIGVPRTLLRCQADAAAVVVEMGMRGLGEIERLSRCTAPNLAVITNIGTAHIGRLGSREAIATAKCEITALLDPTGLVVIPAGDPLLEEALQQVWRGRVRRVALNDDALAPETAAPDVVGSPIGTERMNVSGLSSHPEPLQLALPLDGRHNARNLLLAMAVADELGVDPGLLLNLQLSLPGGRARRLSLKGSLEGVMVLDETYNASPEAVLASLDLLNQQGGRRFAVLGTMLELGDRSEELHRSVGERAAQLGLDGLVVVASGADGEALMAAATGLPRLERVDQPEQAVPLLMQWLQPGDKLLLKASRGVALERLLPLLEQE